MMNAPDKKLEAIQTLALSSDRLQAFSYAQEQIHPLLNCVCLATLRHFLADNRPIFIGFIGCTGTGKSTLFNSLVGENVSEIGWQAHNTCGPVVITHKTFWNRLREIESRNGSLFFPQLKRDIKNYNENNPPSSAGQSDLLYTVINADPMWENRVLIDLPDINTTLAKDEKLVAQQVMPWLDTVVFVMDDETLYHREYEEPSAATNTLGQHIVCVINNRGRDRIDLDHPDVKSVMELFNVETLYVLPTIQNGDRFEQEPEFHAFRQAVLNPYIPAPIQPVLQQCKPLADSIIEENQQRKQVFDTLEKKTQKTIDEEMGTEQPVSFKNILNDDVLNALNHLGLKRFSVSNLFHFLKRLGTTGSLKRSFQVAFGQNRDQALSNVLSMDTEKLENEVRGRINDHCEKIQTVLHRHEESSLIFQADPSFRGLSFIRDIPLQKQLDAIVRDFEQECRNSLSSDKLSTSFKNDPLLAGSVLVILLADWVTIPGFGSWLLVPSVFKYVPIGQFEKIKHRFQQSIHDMIQETLSHVVLHLQTVKSQLVLEERDPLLNALRVCADHEKN